MRRRGSVSLENMRQTEEVGGRDQPDASGRAQSAADHFSMVTHFSSIRESRFRSQWRNGPIWH